MNNENIPSRTMKRTLQASGLFLAILLIPATGFAQTALLSYSFNDSGTTTANGVAGGAAGQFRDSGGGTTDLHGAAGSGVSGAAGDLAFDNSSATGMGNAPASGGYIAISPSGLGALNGLQSFTLSGWFKTSGGAVIGNGARLFDSSTLSLYAPSNGTLLLQVNGQTTTSTSGAYSATGSWVFFAVTYDTTANRATFYEGTTSAAAVAVGSVAFSTNPGVTVSPAGGIDMGNTYGGARPLDGLMDDFALYGSATDGSGALGLSQIQQIQAAAVPEAAAWKLGLLGGLSCLLLARGTAKAKGAR